jgi:pyruvate dehydrogenase E2 component (dihydrolipoamide acetyltransferase)/2-oxoisovalerate dehydrogenase E2 component (dihydrolipoyl transacylase)
MNFHVPELGEGVYEAELVAWHVKAGDVVKRGQSLAEVITDKASMDLPSPFAGVVEELRAQPGEQFKIGDVLLRYHADGEATKQTRRADTESNGRVGERAARVQAAARPNAAPAAQPVAQPIAHSVERVLAAPSVRMRARERGVDLHQVRGTGPGGRILAADLEAAATSLVSEPEREAPKPTEAMPLADLGRAGTRMKLTGLRRTSAQHLVHAVHTAPHFSLIEECDVSDLVRLRAQLKEPLAQQGLKLTYLPFLVKAVVSALKEVPIANASLDDAAGEIILHDHYDVGMAVSTPAGLLVPVVRGADQKSLVEIAREVERLSAEARAGKARREDLRGGTFTITNIGGIGGLISTPILNHPEVGIMGVGRIVKRPVYDASGHIQPADLIYLSFTFDHRVVDGAVAAIFANAVVQRLRQPAAMMLS